MKHKQNDKLSANSRIIRFLCKLAFLTDITKHLNCLNIKLQKEKTVLDLIDHINAFKNQINL